METNIMKKTIFIALLLCLVSCEKNTEKKFSQEDTYLYEILGKNSKNKGFFKRKIFLKKKERTDSIFQLSSDKKFIDTIIKKYIIKEDGLINVETNTYFLNAQKKDSCYQYLDLGEKYELCFLGKTPLEIKGKIYKDAYKYLITQMKEDGVGRYLYFNSDFILLKDTYKEGYAPYFDIILRD